MYFIVFIHFYIDQGHPTTKYSCIVGMLFLRFNCAFNCALVNGLFLNANKNVSVLIH